MAVGFEGSKGILHESIQKKEEDTMALGIEGTKGILFKTYDCTKPRRAFQQSVFRAANGQISFKDFLLVVSALPPRISISAFANNQCSKDCPYCYLRSRGFVPMTVPAAIVATSNNLDPVDFSIVGMEPLETWGYTTDIFELVLAQRKSITTNAMHLDEEKASWLAEHNIFADFSVGEQRYYNTTLEKARMLQKAGVKATASCVVIQDGTPPLQAIEDISTLGLPLAFFPECDVTEKPEAAEMFKKLLKDLRGRKLDTKVLLKVDFLTPNLLRELWQEFFAGADFSEIISDLDEGFLVREISPNLLLGVYPFPGEFINRVRIDADGVLTTCYHMELPLNKRLAIGGQTSREDWLKVPAVLEYHQNYWRNYFAH